MGNISIVFFAMIGSLAFIRVSLFSILIRAGGSETHVISFTQLHCIALPVSPEGRGDRVGQAAFPPKNLHNIHSQILPPIKARVFHLFLSRQNLTPERREETKNKIIFFHKKQTKRGWKE